jgi:hypothetical protein
MMGSGNFACFNVPLGPIYVAAWGFRLCLGDESQLLGLHSYCLEAYSNLAK